MFRIPINVQSSENLYAPLNGDGQREIDAARLRHHRHRVDEGQEVEEEAALDVGGEHAGVGVHGGQPEDQDARHD